MMTMSHLRPFLLVYLAMAGTCFYLAFSSLSGGNNNTDFVKSGESTLFQMIWLILYCNLSLRMLYNKPRVKSLFLKLWPILLLLAVSMSAYALNGAHFASIIKLGMFIFTVLFAAWAAATVSIEEFMENFSMLARLVVILQLAAFPVLSRDERFSLLFDPLQRQTILGVAPYSGLFAHKNLAGCFFGLSLIVEMLKVSGSNERYKIVNVSFSAAQFICLLLSGAVSPLISLIASYILVLALDMLRAKPSTLIASSCFLMAFMLPIVFLADINAEKALALVGRDPGLTGREPLYASWPDFFMRHPFFGYGYAEFFSDEPDAPGAELNSMSGWVKYVNFESGYLQSAIDFGGVGMAIFIVVTLRSIFMGIGNLSFTFQAYRRVPLGIAIFICISSLTDTYIVLHNALYPIFLFYIYFQPEFVRRRPT